MQFKSKYIRHEFADKNSLRIIEFLERLSTIMKLIVSEFILTAKLTVPNTRIASLKADCNDIEDLTLS